MWNQVSPYSLEWEQEDQGKTILNTSADAYWKSQKKEIDKGQLKKMIVDKFLNLI